MGAVQRQCTVRKGGFECYKSFKYTLLCHLNMVDSLYIISNILANADIHYYFIVSSKRCQVPRDPTTHYYSVLTLNLFR